MEVTSDTLAPMTGDAIFCPDDDCSRYIPLSNLVDGYECPTCGTKMVLDVVHDADGDEVDG